MKIYTRTGDDGSTGLWGGQRLSKDDLRIEAYGTVDELSAVLGLVRSTSGAAWLDTAIQEIQSDLFTMGAALAAAPGATLPCGMLTDTDIERLERSIDQHEETLSPLKTFILPGGCPLAATLHLARVTCRRAERRVISLSHQSTVANEIIVYLNRLSDLLFVLARQANLRAETDDIPWSPRR